MQIMQNAIKTVLFIIDIPIEVDVLTFDDTTSSKDIKLRQWTGSLPFMTGFYQKRATQPSIIDTVQNYMTNGSDLYQLMII